MKDLWSELARRARKSSRPDESMPFGFDAAVLRRLAAGGRENVIDSWLLVVRPALGLAFATAILCVLLQARAEKDAPSNLLVETESLLQLAVLK
jgi:hypothetical protein